MHHQRLFSDNNARVPFSIIGVFLLLSSSLTAVYLSDIDTITTDSIISYSSNSDIRLIISNAEEEISQLINNIGMKSLQEIGINPVLISRVEGKTADEINQIRFKKSLIARLNPLLDDVFSDNNYQNHRYALNIEKDKNNQYIFDDLSDITVTPVKMKVTRPIHIPLIGPDENEVFDTYWKISIPILFEIIDLKNNQVIGTHPTTISKVITSRYPLLYQLIKDYNQTINGLGPLWGFFTSVANIYSLTRGYKHYSSGSPKNIVDNRHLAPLINTGLLFEQGLCFGCVDPVSLVELLKNCKKSLLNKNFSDSIATLNSLNSSSVNILSSWFTETDSYFSENNEEKKEIVTPKINISEIALSILYEYKSIEIIYKNVKTNEFFSEIIYDVNNKDIQNHIEDNLEDHIILFDIKPISYKLNETTNDMIIEIVDNCYSAGFNTQVIRDDNPQIILGPHDDYHIDNGSSQWSINDIQQIAFNEKPPIGKIQIGTTIYQEIYNIVWTREHDWSKREQIGSGNNTTIRWDYHKTTDTKIETNVSLEIIVHNIGLIPSINDPVHHIFYEIISFDDMNLEDTILKYKNTVFFPNLQFLLESSEGSYFYQFTNGSHEPWVLDESLDALEEIIEEMSDITVDDSINATRYPNPLVLLSKSKENLLIKYQERIQDMKNKTRYMENDEFISNGKKAVYAVRSWFVDFTYQYISRIFENMNDEITSQIDSTNSANEFNNQEDVLIHLDKQDDGTFDLQSFSIPFGLPLRLDSLPDSFEIPWNESIQIITHQTPSYLSPFYKEEYDGKKEYFLSVRNVCSLGPTGMPILPITPTTPWLISLNIWYISIRGSYAEFVLSDGNDETIPNPFFGHDMQTMRRKNMEIFDEHGTIIGLNTRISFSLDTLSFSVVPSWGKMVGETDGILMEEHGFD